MKFTILAMAALALVGCGADSTVTVGEKGQKGVVRSDIDQSRSAANRASDMVRENDKAADGG